MSPSAPEDEGLHGRKRSRGGEERPWERERPRRDEKERPDRRRDGERDARRRRDERDGDRDGSRRPRRRFRDSIDAPHPPDGGGRKQGISKVEEEDEKKGADGGRDRDRVDGPPQRSRSYFQHDDRGSAGHGGRDMVYRAGEQGRWNDIKEQSGDRFRENRSSRDNPLKKDEDPRPPKLDDDSAWKHDGFYELEVGAPPPRKRPAFREKKPEGWVVAAGESADLPPRHEKSGIGQVIREDGGQNPRGRERYERSFAGGGNRDLRRAEGPPPRYGHHFKDRYGVASGARGRDRFGGRRYDGRNFHQPGGIQVEKWKHDLFEEANRSPTPKNDEDKLAKLEALLAS